MQVTIVGLPGSGKTTVFNALTGGHAETGGFSGARAAPNVSVVKVPDARVDRLAALFHPKKTVYADVTYVDVAIPAGATREGTVSPDVLAQVRNADALLHVARAFDDPAAPTPGDPWRDIDDLDVEFTVDLVKRKNIGWPRLETQTHVMVLGSARPLLEAFQIATAELQRWLMADYGMTERGAQTFMGQATEYEVANVVDPSFTVVAKIRKDLLPRR